MKHPINTSMMKPIQIIKELVVLRRQINLNEDLAEAREWLIFEINGYIHNLRQNYIAELKALKKLKEDDNG